MNNIEEYISSFFDTLEIYEDICNCKNHKEAIIDSIMEFLSTKTTDSAYKVYETFFVAYWIGIQNEKNPFLELPQIMNRFEEKAGGLLEKHRDHYVHTIFVFLLGLAIYEKNDNFKKNFNEYALNKKNYPDFYVTKNEEFFYRWGIASLFHDIAYPLEISLKQANKYLDFICNYPEEVTRKSKIKMELSDFEYFMTLPPLKPGTIFENDFLKKYPKSKYKFYADATSILSQSISSNFSLNIDDVKTNIIGFVKFMKEESFIDHGFYGAVIILRWYYHLVKTTNWNPSYFYFPVADSASAIFLHNYYKYGLMNKPFYLECMKVKSHPIAYLLILCDGLQEWNRKDFGENASSNTTITDFNVTINNSKMDIHYEFTKEANRNIYKDLPTLLQEVVQISDIFKEKIAIKEM
jgi:hypothetical protein